MDLQEERELSEYLARIAYMGEIRTVVDLENEVDVQLSRLGKLTLAEVRRAKIDAVVDTGAVMVLLPRDVVEALGLLTFDRRTVILADERTVELDRAGTLSLTIAGRETKADCLVGPAGCEPLIGQLVLEALDLIPDPRNRTLSPRPESPLGPTLKMKSQLRNADRIGMASYSGR